MELKSTWISQLTFINLFSRTFLNDLGGNPNKKNSSNETSLHMACNLAQQKSLSAQERRAACVTLLLQWRGVPLSNGDKEKISLTAIDQVNKIHIFSLHLCSTHNNLIWSALPPCKSGV
jgi:hypothetical protein